MAVCTLSVLTFAPRIFREHFQLTSISLASEFTPGTLLMGYQDQWRASLGKYINMGMMFRELYKAMDNPSIDKVFQRAKPMKSGLDGLDMDFPEMDLAGLL